MSEAEKKPELITKTIEQLECDQNRLEELLFLVDARRRPRIHKMLSQIRQQIAAATPTAQAPSALVQLRERRGELEDKLFHEAPERRPEIKKMLGLIRAEIEAAEAAALIEGERENFSDMPKVA
jgi:hypothetical protein